MKSLQDYIDIYRGIANKLNITGDSVEILSQICIRYFVVVVLA